jgi:hypothetical protein
MRSKLAARIDRLERSYFKPAADTRPLMLADGTFVRVKVLDLLRLTIELNKQRYPDLFDPQPDPVLVGLIRDSVERSVDTPLLQTCRHLIQHPPDPDDDPTECAELRAGDWLRGDI